MIQNQNDEMQSSAFESPHESMGKLSSVNTPKTNPVL